MKRILVLLTAVMLTAATTSYGTIFWQNLGNTSAYNFSNSMDSVEGVSSPSYIGSEGAIAATCTYQGSGVRYHSEWTPTGTWNHGSTAYFGYAIYLPTSFQFTGTQRAVTEQYGLRHASGGTIVPDLYQAWIGGGTANEMQFGGGGISDQNTGTMTSGAWHTVVTKMTYGSGGNITVWFDGNQAWSLNTTVNGSGSGDTNGLWALGLYEADWDGGNTGNGTDITVYGAGATIATTYAEANPITYHFSGNYQIQCVASGLSLNVSGASTTNGAQIIQYSYSGTPNELWTFIPTSNGYYQINNENSGKDAVVQGASTANGAKIIQWSFGSSGDDQWMPVQNSDGTYTFYNLHSGLVLDDPGFSQTSGTQFDQWTANGGSNQKFNLINH